MALVSLISGRADLYCDNCESMQSQEIRLCWNSTTEELYVEKECVCFNAAVKYKETFGVATPEK